MRIMSNSLNAAYSEADTHRRLLKEASAKYVAEGQADARIRNAARRILESGADDKAKVAALTALFE